MYCEDDYRQFVESVVQYYSFCLVIDSVDCDDSQLELLIKVLTEQKFISAEDNEQISKDKNKKNCFLNMLHSKPLIYSWFTKDLLNVKLEPLQQLQLKIIDKRDKIHTNISKFNSNEPQDSTFA